MESSSMLETSWNQRPAAGKESPEWCIAATWLSIPPHLGATTLRKKLLQRNEPSLTGKAPVKVLVTSSLRAISGSENVCVCVCFFFPKKQQLKYSELSWNMCFFSPKKIRSNTHVHLKIWMNSDEFGDSLFSTKALKRRGTVWHPQGLQNMIVTLGLETIRIYRGGLWY